MKPADCGTASIHPLRLLGKLLFAIPHATLWSKFVHVLSSFLPKPLLLFLTVSRHSDVHVLSSDAEQLR
jgi:hypothetical protein